MRIIERTARSRQTMERTPSLTRKSGLAHETSPGEYGLGVPAISHGTGVTTYQFQYTRPNRTIFSVMHDAPPINRDQPIVKDEKHVMTTEFGRMYNAQGRAGTVTRV